MDESSLSSAIPETEIAPLKDALSAQHQVLQKLQAELEKEREASATAANEALSMILRLQGERAAEKMEAHQYKRMAEEKMRHADESLVVLEDLIHRKEMEVAYLEFQIQACRQKLSSFDFIDLSIGEIKFPDHGTVRRNSSLPVMRYKGSKSKKSTVVRGPSISLLQNTDDMGCVLEEIDGWVKDSSCNKFINEGNQPKSDSRNKETPATKETCSVIVSLDKSKSSCSSSQAEDSEKFLELDADSSRCLGTTVIGNSINSTSIHDKFEIPQNHDAQQLCEPQKKVEQLPFLEAEKRLGKPDSVPCETVKYHFKDETQRIKNAVVCTTDHSKLSASQKGVTIECCWPLLDSKIGITPSQVEFQQLDKRLLLLEEEFWLVKKESSDRREEELKLLTEIREHLKSLQSQIRSSKARKKSPLDDSLMVCFMEAMLHCSL